MKEGGILVKTDDFDPPPIKVGLTYNLKKDNASEEEAEFDSIETINAIKSALEKTGCNVTLLEADNELPHKLLSNKPEIVFNVAEGRNGRSREAHVPAILSYYGIEFTGSDETTLCLCLDKALSKRILAAHKVKTPKFYLAKGADSKIPKTLCYPLIAKPNAEGSSKGITAVSVASNEKELKAIIKEHFTKSNTELLIEEFITGRELTVGVLGNGEDTIVLRPMEIAFKDNGLKYNVYDFNIKKDCMKYIDYHCPAKLRKDTEDLIRGTAKKIYNILECRDLARIDFILTEFNELYFVEINPLPGLTPGYSDFPMLCERNGIKYDTLIGAILKAAIKRVGLGGQA